MRTWHFLGEILTCLIGHILTENLQRLGMDAEEQPASLCVEEGAAGLHPSNQLSGGLFTSKMRLSSRWMMVSMSCIVSSFIRLYISFTNVRKEIRAAIDIHEEES